MTAYIVNRTVLLGSRAVSDGNKRFLFEVSLSKNSLCNYIYCVFIAAVCTNSTVRNSCGHVDVVCGNVCDINCVTLCNIVRVVVTFRR